MPSGEKRSMALIETLTESGRVPDPAIAFAGILTVIPLLHAADFA
jgi:hypothetical protein